MAARYAIVTPAEAGVQGTFRGTGSWIPAFAGMTDNVLIRRDHLPIKLSGKADGSDGEIDQLYTDERHDDAAEAVDQQVTAQDARRTRRAVLHAA